MVLSKIFFFAENLVGEMGCLDDIFVGFYVDVITEDKNFS